MQSIRNNERIRKKKVHVIGVLPLRQLTHPIITDEDFGVVLAFPHFDFNCPFKAYNTAVFCPKMPRGNLDRDPFSYT